MGACIGVTMQKMKRKSEKRVLMVGLDNAGKTTILYKIQLDEVVSTIPTVGLNIETIKYKDMKLSVWDLGGQLIITTTPHNMFIALFLYIHRKQIRSIWSHYFKDTDAIIFVIDSNEPQRIDELKGDNARDELHKLLKHKQLKDAVILIFANKIDLPHAVNINELTERLQLNNFSDRIWHIQETCAMSGDGLLEGLDWLSAAIEKKTTTKRKKNIRNTQKKYNQLNE